MQQRALKKHAACEQSTGFLWAADRLLAQAIKGSSIAVLMYVTVTHSSLAFFHVAASSLGPHVTGHQHANVSAHLQILHMDLAPRQNMCRRNSWQFTGRDREQRTWQEGPQC